MKSSEIDALRNETHPRNFVMRKKHLGGPGKMETEEN